jgi:hypothetical protein
MFAPLRLDGLTWVKRALVGALERMRGAEKSSL